MDRDQATGLLDLGISIAKQTAASTATPHDDTLVRYLEFARNDKSFEQFLDWKFGPRPAPLLAADGTPQNASVIVVVEDEVAPEAQDLTQSAQLFARKENLSAEQVLALVAAAKAIFQAIKLFRQSQPTG